jgi:YfiH family protein
MNGWIDAALPGVVAGATVRLGGGSTGSHLGLNLGSNTQDADANVAANRRMFAGRLPPHRQICWMHQVHGVQVVERGTGAPQAVPEADAQWTAQRGVVLTVLTADCLPVLLCDEQAHCVAAAHAGWRGLAAGVLQHTLASLPVAAQRLRAWIGPAISVRAFEVGEDVLQAFLHSPFWRREDVLACCRAAAPGKYWFDMAELARRGLRAAGVEVRLSGLCTHRDQRFYSYRRDGETGRQASFILLPMRS